MALATICLLFKSKTGFANCNIGAAGVGLLPQIYFAHSENLPAKARI